MRSNIHFLTIFAAATAFVGCASQPMAKGTMGAMARSCENCNMLPDGKAGNEGSMAMMKMGMTGAETKSPTTTSPSSQPQDDSTHLGG